MRTSATLRLLAALIALTFVAAACGSDDTDTGADDSAPEDSAPEDSAPQDSAMEDMDHGDDTTDHDGADHDEMDHGDDSASDDSAMDEGTTGETHEDHGTVDVEGDVVPTVDVEVTADPSGGVNVAVATSDFTVAPHSASTDHVEGEGHYHLFIDGEKQRRFYNDCLHVPGVVEGDVEIGVALSANDHRTYAVDGEAIMATTSFTVPEHVHDEHAHGELEPIEWDGEGNAALELEVVDDPKSGWNAFVDVEGLELSCENVSGDHVAGEGHLHVFANGEKIDRIYGTATYIPVLPEGDVGVSVAAYSNDHRPYVVDGEPVEASLVVTVPAAS